MNYVFYCLLVLAAINVKIIYIEMSKLIDANFMSTEVDNCRLYEYHLQTLRLFQEKVKYEFQFQLQTL